MLITFKIAVRLRRLALVALLSIVTAVSTKAVAGDGEVLVVKKEIGRSVQNRPIEVFVIGNGPEHILIGASIHGTERAGTPIVQRLLNWLPNRPDIMQGRTVSLIPIMNPDGYHWKTRGNSRGVDLNRNFPAVNRQNTAKYGMTAFSEPESKAWYDYMTSSPAARMVIMHQPYNMVDWDGPAQDLARFMARHTIMPEQRVGARPGSMGSHYGVDKNTAIITFEMPKYAERHSDDYLWNAYGRSIVAAITWPRPVSFGYFQSRYRWDLVAPLLILAGGICLVGWRPGVVIARSAVKILLNNSPAHHFWK